MLSVVSDYKQRRADKGLTMMKASALQDNQAQDFYGKVIDQFGQPVAGADVTVWISLTIGTGDTCKTQTDARGLFEFVGIRGKL